MATIVTLLAWLVLLVSAGEYLRSIPGKRGYNEPTLPNLYLAFSS
jgi:hypothetical protein